MKNGLHFSVVYQATVTSSRTIVQYFHSIYIPHRHHSYRLTEKVKINVRTKYTSDIVSSRYILDGFNH